jgi:hypothetical protein
VKAGLKACTTSFLLEHTLDEHTRIDGTNAGADNRQQI